MSTISPLPAHLDQSIEDLAKLHHEHRQSAGRRLRAIAGVTAWLSQPSVLLGIVAVVAAWFVYAVASGQGEPHSWAMASLELVTAVLALLVAIVILVAQRHEDELAARRAELTLEFALLSDRRAAKIIQLLEELRRDTPAIVDRVDHESAELAAPTDPHAVLDELEKRSQEGTPEQRPND